MYLYVIHSGQVGAGLLHKVSKPGIHCMYERGVSCCHPLYVWMGDYDKCGLKVNVLKAAMTVRIKSIFLIRLPMPVYFRASGHG